MEGGIDRCKDITGVVQNYEEGREEEEEYAGEASDRPGQEVEGGEGEVGKGGWHVFVWWELSRRRLEERPREQRALAGD